MRVGVLALAVALLGCTPEVKPPAPLTDSGRSVVEEARIAISESRPQDAVAPLRALLEARPEDAHARGVLAHALLVTRDLPAARAEGRIAIAFDPTLSEVAWNLACAEALDGRIDPAIAWLQRALATGAWEPADVAGDPDLAALAEDHRVAVYLATGVLSRAETDAVAVLDRERVAAGQEATLSIASIQLNQELLSDAASTLSALPEAAPRAALVQRVETFVRGSAGGREYSQRTVHLTFVPTEPGLLVLGPFAVASGERRLLTAPVALHVDGDPTEPPVGFATAEFVAFPSQADPVDVAFLVARGVESIAEGQGLAEASLPDWEPLADGSEARLLRFKSAVPGIPAWVPPRPPDATRSALVRRSTEGWSWVLDRRRAS